MKSFQTALQNGINKMMFLSPGLSSGLKCSVKWAFVHRQEPFLGVRECQAEVHLSQLLVWVFLNKLRLLEPFLYGELSLTSSLCPHTNMSEQLFLRNSITYISLFFFLLFQNVQSNLPMDFHIQRTHVIHSTNSECLMCAKHRVSYLGCWSK